jgi:hypothetical protein
MEDLNDRWFLFLMSSIRHHLLNDVFRQSMRYLQMIAKNIASIVGIGTHSAGILPMKMMVNKKVVAYCRWYGLTFFEGVFFGDHSYC